MGGEKLKGKSKDEIKDDGQPFSKAKQLRGALSQATDYAKEQIAGAEKLAKLKALVKETEGVTLGVSKSNNHVSMKGWIEYPDKRYYMRSSWERNYSRYLQWLKDNKEIRDWGYEVMRFDFPIKRGSNSYLPDFQVITNDGQIEYHEIKGYLAAKDRTKMKRFMKYFPYKKLVLIDKEQYKAIAKEVKNLIGGWE